MQEKSGLYRTLILKPLRRLRWLAPGLGIKRWMVTILLGAGLIGIGIAVLILEAYRTTPETWRGPLSTLLELEVLPAPVRIVLYLLVGLVLIWIGTIKVNRALLKPYLTPGQPILDTVSTYHKRERGPRVVAIGGGTGLSALLRGLKRETNRLTAVVTVADDGGSSGKLRRSMGVLPPGDIRNCLAAMADDEQLLTQIFQYRFGQGAGLEGHNLGNLFLTAMADISGSFEGAVAEAGRVLAIRGKVLPSTLHDVRLVADVAVQGERREVRVKGESEITAIGGKIQRLWLEPDNPLAYPPAIQAILGADLVVLGPGSLFTSLLPNLLVPDLAEALRSSRALKIYVCNVATQPGETDGFTCLDHVRTLEKHVGAGLFDLIICNNHYEGKLPASVDWVRPGDGLEAAYSVYYGNLVDEDQPWRHDSKKLADVIMDLFYERTGPMVPQEEEYA